MATKGLLRVGPVRLRWVATESASRGLSSHIQPQVVPKEEGKSCPLCRNGLERFGYKDVLLLRQFLSPTGMLFSRRVTGICPKMQKKMATAIKRSRKRGLLPNFKAPESGVTVNHSQ